VAEEGLKDPPMKPTPTTYFATVALALLASTALPACAQQKLVPAQSDISFTSRQMGVPVDGKFKSFDAQVAFDPKKPEAAKIAMTIDLASVALGVAETEAELKKPEWFATKQFPKASFESTSVKPAGAGKYEVAGKLNIKGTSQNVVVPVTLVQAGGNTTANGSFTIKRLDFRIGDGDWKDTSMVANDVQVKFKLALTGVPSL
jgi:polyisoprenoid-binding protein YceI